MNLRAWLTSWFPLFVKYGGLVGVIFMAVFWAITHRLEPTLLTFFGGMMGLGEGLEALKELLSSPQHRSSQRSTIPPARKKVQR